MLRKEYIEYTREFEKVYQRLKGVYRPDSADTLAEYRHYAKDSIQHRMLKEYGIGACNLTDYSILGKHAKELGLLSKEGYFLLNNRYIVDIRDIENNLIALVGYYPDVKKYITTPSRYFGKDTCFFNFHDAYKLSYAMYGGAVFLVEGIFDTLSLKACGIPVIGTMGNTVDIPKSELLKVFTKVIAVPDNDKAGKRCTNRTDLKSCWKLPEQGIFIRLQGKLHTPYGDIAIKDVDNMVGILGAENTRELLIHLGKSREDVSFDFKEIPCN